MPDDLNLLFRPVRSEDKPRVIEFTAHTWDDGDYIPEVFDAWLADPQGQFTAIELAGQTVAIGKLTELGAGELWLEGLRVDPEHRRKGIGEELHNYHVELARQIGGRVLRYATGQNNVVSRMFGDRTGFQHVGAYRWHNAQASADFAPPDVLSLDDWPALRPWLNSALLRSSQGLYQRGWKWAELSESRLTAHLTAGEVFGLPSLLGAGWRAWALGAHPPGWEETQMYYLDGTDRAALIEMAQAMRRLAADLGTPRVDTLALDVSSLNEVLAESGYRADESVMVIYELPLDASPPEELRA